MSSVTAFAAPASGRTRDLSRTPLQKRKRNPARLDTATGHREESTQDGTPTSSLSAEYSTVLTPIERSQKRLAGLPIDQRIPFFPFPHASAAAKKYNINGPFSDHGDTVPVTNRTTRLSLHAQHLAVVSAILHRSMMNHDYVRARRAFGMILRNDIGGRPIDIRTDGLWGCGAEILLYLPHVPTATTATSIDSNAPSTQITSAGFEHSRTYYENLMIQYPIHKTWPNVINALDFCIAMFDLWIYVTYQGSLQMQAAMDTAGFEDDSEGPRSFYECKMWEAEQAKRIAEALDNRMKDVMYRDDQSLIRLRSMVTTWLADARDACAELNDDDVDEDQVQ